MIVGLVALGRLGLRPLFRGVARTHSPELFMAACLLVVLATGLAAAAAGLSMELGALIAGLLLAETEYRRQIEVTVEPFKGLLLGVFLISIGMSLDLGQVAAQPALVLGARPWRWSWCKAALVVGLARLFRVRWAIGLQAGLLLAPGGEFSFVILALGAKFGLVPDGLGGVDFLVAALTMAAIPLLAQLGTPGRPAGAGLGRAGAAAAARDGGRPGDRRRVRPRWPHRRVPAGRARHPLHRARQRRGAGRRGAARRRPGLLW